MRMAEHVKVHLADKHYTILRSIIYEFFSADVDECAENILNCPNGTVCRNAVGHANCESDICIAFRNQNFIPSISYEDKCCDNSNLGNYRTKLIYIVYIYCIFK